MLFGAIGWYGALIGGGMALCVIIAYFMAKRRGFYSDMMFDAAIICLPLAIIGARAYYVINTSITGSHTWTMESVFGFVNGEFVGLSGLAIYGGLAGGIIGLIIVSVWNKHSKNKEKQLVNIIHLLDVCFCLVILGQAIGRWGNFANQEAYGQLITDPAWQWFPFAVFIEAEGNWFNACFFYESAWNTIGFCILMWLYNGRRKSFDGFCFAFYCIWYGFIRFWVEGLRSDSMWFGPIKANQLISAVIFIFGVGIVVYHIIKAKKEGKKPFILVPEDVMGYDYLWYENSSFDKIKKIKSGKVKSDKNANKA